MVFDNKTEDFVLGFEVGQIFEIMQTKGFIEVKPIHRTNKRQIIKIMEYFGAKYSIKDYDETWAELTCEIVKPHSISCNS